MNVFFHHLLLCAPLFLMVFLGWVLVKIGMFSHNVTKALSQFVFKLLMPVMLFHLMSDGSNRPPVDCRFLRFLRGGVHYRKLLGRQAL